jgi:transcriptional regulator with XRE-family HTH domain
MSETTRDRILKIRDTLGLTQTEFCKRIFVSQTYFSNVENGNRKVNDRIIALICSQYGVNKKYLIEGIGDMFSEDLPDIHLAQLLEMYDKLEKPLQECVVSQVRLLVEAWEKSKNKNIEK